MRRGVLWLPLLVILLAPIVFGGYVLRLATEIVVWAFAATSLAFLIRSTGLVSLGHAAFFGGGAYVTGLLVRENPAAYVFALPLAVGAGLVMALVLGFVSLRSRGIYFLMVTLAFSYTIYVLVKQGFAELTGGDNGLSAVPRPPGFEDPSAFYAAGTLLLGIVLWGYQKLMGKPLGYVLDALRLNERRLESLGYHTRWYKLLAFGASGALCALGGVLLAAYRGFIHPNDLSWHTSVLLLVMVVAGGVRRVTSGVIGAIAIILLEAMLSSITPFWNLALGLYLIGYVLYTLRNAREVNPYAGTTS